MKQLQFKIESFDHPGNKKSFCTGIPIRCIKKKSQTLKTLLYLLVGKPCICFPEGQNSVSSQSLKSPPLSSPAAFYSFTSQGFPSIHLSTTSSQKRVECESTVPLPSLWGQAEAPPLLTLPPSLSMVSRTKSKLDPKLFEAWPLLNSPSASSALCYRLCLPSALWERVLLTSCVKTALNLWTYSLCLQHLRCLAQHRSHLHWSGFPHYPG